MFTEKKTFIKQYLNNKQMIGSIVPSSRFLTQAMLRSIDFKQARVIVEIGPGTGVFTREIIKRMQADAILLVFELNERFYADLKEQIQDERVHFIHDAAQEIHRYLEKYSILKADVIISSVPLSNLPETVRYQLIETTQKALTEQGQFIQYQYSLQAKKILTSIYPKVNISLTLFNIPPAFVYVCQNRASC